MKSQGTIKKSLSIYLLNIWCTRSKVCHQTREYCTAMMWDHSRRRQKREHKQKKTESKKSLSKRTALCGLETLKCQRMHSNLRLTSQRYLKNSTRKCLIWLKCQWTITDLARCLVSGILGSEELKGHLRDPHS